MAGQIPGAQGLLGNPMLAMLAPDQQQNLLQLQQRQAIGQAMLAQGMQPIDTSNRVVAGRAYRVSPLEGVSKLLQTYLGNKLSMDSMGQQAQLMGQMYGNAFGVTPQAAPQADAAATPAGPQAAAPDAGFGPGAGNFMSGVQPSGQQLGAAMMGAPPGAPPTVAAAPPRAGALTLPGKTPQESMQIFSMVGPEAYGKMLSEWGAPTAATKAAQQGGFDSQAANRVQFKHDSFLAPVQLGANQTILNPSTGALSTTPAAAPAGYQNILGADGKYYTVKVAGGPEAVQESEAAKAGGSAQYSLNKVWDPNYIDPQSGQRGGYVMQTTANIAGATTPDQRAIVQTESGGNPGAVSPKGAMGAWQVMPNTNANPGFGVAPARDNSPAELNRVGKDYYEAMSQRYGSPTLGAIAYNMGPGATDTWLKGGGNWEKLPQETRNYIGKVSTLTAVNTVGRQAPASATPRGPMAAEPSLGVTANADAQARAQIESMQNSYKGLQGMRSGGNMAMEDIDKMIGLASGKSPLTAGSKLAEVAGIFSANAAEYEKSRDNLVTNLGSQLGVGSDAARAMVYGSIPAYGAPKEAIEKGLATLRGQVQMRMLKADHLSDAYGKSDANAYNQRENAFDQNMSPQLAGIISMPSGQARADALRAAAKDPQVRSRLEWAAEHGVLK